MSSLLKEILNNFEDFENAQRKLSKSARSEFSEYTSESISPLTNSILVTAEEKDVLLEKKHPFGYDADKKNIVDEAHPEPVMMADGPERSGVVDNQNEQHEKIVNMVNKTPTGNVFHNFSFASEVKELVAMANILDSKGYSKEADALEYVAAELVNLKKKAGPKIRNLRTKPNRPNFPAREKTDDYIERVKDVGVLSQDLPSQPWYSKVLQHADTAMALFGVSSLGSGLLSKIMTAVRGSGLAAILGKGAAALGISGASAWAALAVLLGAPFIISAYNGIAETFEKDLADLKESLESLLEDKSNPSLNTIQRKMLAIISELERHHKVLDSGTEDPSRLGIAAGKISALLKELERLAEQHTISERGMLPDFLSDALSSVNDRTSNLKASWEDLLDTLSSKAKDHMELVSDAYERSIEEEGAGKTMDKDRGVVPPNDSSQPTTTPTTIKAPTVNSNDNVRSMQEFLLTLPDSFWQKAGFNNIRDLEAKGPDGEMDALTRAALDAFALHIGEDLGVTNLDSTRLEEVGDGKKLRKIWKIYRRPDLYVE